MGKDPDEFIEELYGVMDPPQGMEWVWDLFLLLHSARQYSSNGPQPLSFTEVYAWSRLTRIHLDPWEVLAIRNLDNVWFEWRVEHGRRSGTRSKN